jgi:uncharacterized protein (UPF0276 family)
MTKADGRSAMSAMPARQLGIGLRAPHIAQVLALRPRVPFLEVHSENHLCGGPMRHALHALRPDYDISLHCVGLSIGSASGLDEAHLARIAGLAQEVDPLFVSDHLSSSIFAGLYSNDLVPVPYTEEMLALAVEHVLRIQEVLGRTILVENPSRYVAWQAGGMPEGEFLGTLAKATACGILCDVNNIYVSARNIGADPFEELSRFPPAAVRELHIAGHATEEDESGTLLIDTHDRKPCDDVLALYAAAQARFDAPALLEWDAGLPALEELLSEAGRIARDAGRTLADAA